MEKVKLAMVGCGNVAHLHMKHILESDKAEIVAICDRFPQNLEKMGKSLPNAKRYENVRDMLDRETPDALVISLIPAAHEDVELLAAERGIPFYIEKPIGLDLARTEEIAQAVERAGILTSVGYQERYNALLDEIKEKTERNRVGMVLGSWIGNMVPQKCWWTTKELSGGQLVEQCTHVFDAMRYLFGEPESVYSACRADLHDDVPDINIEDSSSTTIRFKNGVVATILSGCFCRDWGCTQVGFTVYTDREKLDYEWCTGIRSTSAYEVKESKYYGDLHKNAIDAFIEAVRTNDKSLIKSDYRDGMKTLALTLAANESMITGKVVKL